MKLIKPKFEIIEQPPGVEGIYKMIEIAGRTCYKSEDKITEDSAKEFVNRMIKSGHGAMLEHGTVYLIEKYSRNMEVTPSKYFGNPYTTVIEEIINGETLRYITTNLRVLVENDWLDDLLYACAPTHSHEKRISVRLVCDRGVSHEVVRHRVFSFAQESTRYCNYSKDKFNNELTFIIPSWAEIPDGLIVDSNSEGIWVPNNEYNISDFRKYLPFLDCLATCERSYLDMVKTYTPQQARQVLPNALKTELVMTGTISQWEGFFRLRCAPNAHPDARYLALGLQQEFKNKGYMDA